MKARELMTESPGHCTPDQTARDVARMMIDCDCGAIPVVENHDTDRLIGIVTDRDLAVRGIAEGKGPDTPVEALMSRNPEHVGPEDGHERIEDMMGRKQIRRLPVCDENGRLLGMISQADLARHERELGDHEVRDTVEKISEPAR